MVGVAQIKEAMKGNTKAALFIRDTIGELPTQNVVATNTNINIMNGKNDAEAHRQKVALEEAEAQKLISDAHALEEAGCFAVVLEKIPATLATRVAKELTIPVIGIGAGGGCDGQVLVIADMLGMTRGFSPKFLRRYADLNTIMTDAIGRYVEDVKQGAFPNESEQY